MNIPILALALLPSVHPQPKATLDTAVFAGGCFWGVEAIFEHVKGVRDVVSGYAGGKTDKPSYEDVGGGDTGHAESVQVVFDPAQVSYATLMRVFFSVAHDPTELNRQGPDVGTQYRSAIFYRNDAQKKEAEAYVAQLTKAKFFKAPIVTELSALGRFFAAEDYHQNYMALHPNQPYIVYWDRPKLENFKRGFPELYVEKK
jgi:peptide-methionine (S)-S-oxide reductase